MKKSEESPFDLWYLNIRIISVPEERRERRGQSLFKEITENFPSLGSIIT